MYLPVCLCICLSVYLSVCLCICLSVCQPVCLTFSLSVFLSVSPYVSTLLVYLPTGLYISILLIWSFAYLFLHIYTSEKFGILAICLSVNPSVSNSLFLFLFLFLFLSYRWKEPHFWDIYFSKKYNQRGLHYQIYFGVKCSLPLFAHSKGVIRIWVRKSYWKRVSGEEWVMRCGWGALSSVVDVKRMGEWACE